MIIHHRLTIHPKPLFPRSVSSKNGVSHNIDPADMVGLTNMSDYDISVNKSATLAGQDCDVTLGMHNVKSRQAGSLRISTNHDTLGDVTVTLRKPAPRSTAMPKPPIALPSS